MPESSILKIVRLAAAASSQQPKSALAQNNFRKAFQQSSIAPPQVNPAYRAPVSRIDDRIPPFAKTAKDAAPEEWQLRRKEKE
jgi:hypothetical protein